MIGIPILAVLGAIINRLRGSDIPFTNKLLMSLLLGLLCSGYSVLLEYSLLFIGGIGLNVFLFIWLADVFGHGAGFSAIHGRAQSEVEILPFDWISHKMVPHPHSVAEWRRWGTVWMTLSGGLSYPLFVTLSWLTPISLLIGLVVFSKGLCYAVMRYIPEKYAIEAAEFLFGFIRTAALATVIYIGAS